MIDLVQTSICPSCGAANSCAVARGEPIEHCWCLQSATRLPLPTDTNLGCYCSTCLQRATAATRDEAH